MLSHIPVSNIKSVIIGNDIVLKPGKNTIQDIKNGKNAALNNIACQLFLYLLQNGKEISTRDEVLLNVFQHNGARATDANLNQHISSIRKAITTLGHSAEILVTIPRVGFNIIEESIHFNLNHQPEQLTENDAYQGTPSPKVEYNKRGLTTLVASVLLSILAVILTWKLTQHGDALPMGQISILRTAKWQQCKLHIMGNVITDNFTEKRAMDVFRSMHYQPDCSSEKDIYINIWQSNHQPIDWKFIAECGYNEGYYHCISRYNYHE